MSKVIFFILFALLLSFYGCVTIRNKKEFTYYQNTNASNLDLVNVKGYYYWVDSSYRHYNYKIVEPTKSNKGMTGVYQDSIREYGIRPIILYKDGRAFVLYEYRFSGLQEFKNTLVGENTYSAAKISFEKYLRSIESKNLKSKKWGIWNWGIYKFENNKILIQYFANNIGNYELIELQGEIIDSESFKIVSSLNHFDSKRTIENRSYRFQSHNFKPDSSNNYLNKLINRINK